MIPGLGSRKLRELSADDVDTWLDAEAGQLSTDTLRKIYSILKRAVAHAEARDKVKRNVVSLCKVPNGQPGRQSKSLTLDQARAVLDAADRDDSAVGNYIVVSLTTGARTEEARALCWDLVDLTGNPAESPPVPPSISVWRSVREGGDTKTEKSRRTLRAPERAVRALERQRARQEEQRRRAGGSLDRDWPRVHDPERNRAQCSKRQPSLPTDPRNGRRGWRAVDATGATP